MRFRFGLTGRERCDCDRCLGDGTADCNLCVDDSTGKGSFKCYVTFFSGKLDTPPTPHPLVTLRNAGRYTPQALRNAHRRHRPPPPPFTRGKMSCQINIYCDSRASTLCGTLLNSFFGQISVINITFINYSVKPTKSADISANQTASKTKPPSWRG